MFESAFVPKAAERPEPTPRLLWVVFGLCVLMLLYQLYDGWLGRQVSSRQPIGSVVKVTGEGRTVADRNGNRVLPGEQSTDGQQGRPAGAGDSGEWGPVCLQCSGDGLRTYSEAGVPEFVRTQGSVMSNESVKRLRNLPVDRMG
jgi:hypothetical protein